MCNLDAAFKICAGTTLHEFTIVRERNLGALPFILEIIPTSEVSKKFSTKVPFRMIIFWLVPKIRDGKVSNFNGHQTLQSFKVVNMRHFCC